MRYAPFSDEEYSCIAPDLKGIDEIITLIDVEATIGAIDRQLESLIREKPSRGQAVERLQSEVAGLSEAKALNSQDRKVRLEQLIDVVRVQMHEAWNIRPVANGRISELAVIVYNTYSVFDSAKFIQDSKELILSEVGETVEDRIKQLNSEKKEIAKYAKKNCNGRVMASLLRFVPDVWRDRKIGIDFSREDMATHILKSLVVDWRERSRYYVIPVTVGGTAIATLEPELSELWMGFYERLGLKPGESSVFQYRDAEGNTKKRRSKSLELPGFFGNAEEQVAEEQVAEVK